MVPLNFECWVSSNQERNFLEELCTCIFYVFFSFMRRRGTPCILYESPFPGLSFHDVSRFRMCLLVQTKSERARARSPLCPSHSLSLISSHFPFLNRGRPRRFASVDEHHLRRGRAELIRPDRAVTRGLSTALPVHFLLEKIHIGAYSD